MQPEPVAQHAEGELRVPDGYHVLSGGVDGRRAVGIVVSRYNGEITNRLLERALAELEEVGVPREAIMVMPVPGAFELPLAAMALAKTRRYACIVALGCVIRGETPHFDLIAHESASGLQLAAIETGVPVAFGVLTVDSRKQAEERIDRAADAVRSALEMADVFSSSGRRQRDLALGRRRTVAGRAEAAGRRQTDNRQSAAVLNRGIASDAAAAAGPLH